MTDSAANPADDLMRSNPLWAIYETVIGVIGLSAYSDRQFVIDLLNAGALGYVTKAEAGEESRGRPRRRRRRGGRRRRRPAENAVEA